MFEKKMDPNIEMTSIEKDKKISMIFWGSLLTYPSINILTTCAEPVIVLTTNQHQHTTIPKWYPHLFLRQILRFWYFIDPKHSTWYPSFLVVYRYLTKYLTKIIPLMSLSISSKKKMQAFSTRRVSHLLASCGCRWLFSEPRTWPKRSRGWPRAMKT